MLAEERTCSCGRTFRVAVTSPETECYYCWASRPTLRPEDEAIVQEAEEALARRCRPATFTVSDGETPDTLDREALEKRLAIKVKL